MQNSYVPESRSFVRLAQHSKHRWICYLDNMILRIAAGNKKRNVVMIENPAFLGWLPNKFAICLKMILKILIGLIFVNKVFKLKGKTIFWFIHFLLMPIMAASLVVRISVWENKQGLAVVKKYKFKIKQLD